jgi:hypothetical protein
VRLERLVKDLPLMIVLNSAAVADDNGRTINRARRVSLAAFTVLMPE